VVTDLEAAQRRYTEWFGVPEWTPIPDVCFSPDSRVYRGEYRGAPADYTIQVALGYAGPQQIELIHPVRGESLYTEAPRRCGPGVHPVAWVPQDFDPAVSRARAQGLEPAQSGSARDREFVYLETPQLGAHVVELLRISERVNTMFERMKDSAFERMKNSAA